MAERHELSTDNDFWTAVLAFVVGGLLGAAVMYGAVGARLRNEPLPRVAPIRPRIEIEDPAARPMVPARAL